MVQEGDHFGRTVNVAARIADCAGPREVLVSEQAREAAASADAIAFELVGDADPLLAIADALPTFPADEIVIAAGRNSTRLAEGLAARARELFALPTSHTAEPLPRAA